MNAKRKRFFFLFLLVANGNELCADGTVGIYFNTRFSQENVEVWNGAETRNSQNPHSDVKTINEPFYKHNLDWIGLRYTKSFKTSCKSKAFLPDYESLL